MATPINLLVIEGLDRTGKDTLAERFHYETDAVCIEHNQFRDFTQKEYYETTRTMMRDPINQFVSEVTTAMAITEFMQVLTMIRRYEKDGLRDFCISRLFPSTVVFDAIRGIKNEVEDRIQTLLYNFERANGIQINMKLLTLLATKEVMKERGSTDKSFEIRNYDEIVKTYSKYTNEHASKRYLFKKAAVLNVSNMTKDETFESARTFLFTN
ncbi:hypothetical protein EVB55_140 [Rhizobium phage RHph_Y68]|uniref:Uncharacterized protein n=1 Tax=Rhizobium phage RHph_Y68 TaxID=2509787 RepID=A0A7S5QYB5_9CAUD|nr:hypothetical protein PP934_gp140 [Rhizobium phage RHph_Y68]QIG68075.1 hypothetical protein EVB55_140 [Rhizobium phage RHph_Y68]